MAWSYSALKSFENCARQYNEMQVLKNYPWEETDSKLYGKELHTAAENYIQRRDPLPPQFAFMQALLDALIAKKGLKLTEYKMALNNKLEPCKYMAKDVWVRTQADLLILNEEDHIAWVVDWKTGNDKYADKEQLDIISLLVFQHFPEIEQVNSALAFVIKDNFIKHKRKRMEGEVLWWDYRNRVAKMDKARANNVWNPTQTGLCKKHCAVLSCEFNGRNE